MFYQHIRQVSEVVETVSLQSRTCPIHNGTL